MSPNKEEMVREMTQIRDKVIQMETKLLKKSNREDKCRMGIK